MRILSVLIVCIVVLLYTPLVNANQECQLQVIDMSDYVFSVDYSVTDLLAITTINGVEIYDQNRDFVAQLNLLNTEMDYAVWANNSNLLLIAGNAPNIQIWDYDSKQLAYEIESDGFRISNAKWTFDDKYIFFRQSDGVYMYEVATSELHILATPDLKLNDLEDGSMRYLPHPNEPLVLLSALYSVILMNYETKEVLFDFTTNAFRYEILGWIDNGNAFISTYSTQLDFFFGEFHIVTLHNLSESSQAIIFSTNNSNGRYIIQQRPLEGDVAIFIDNQIKLLQTNNQLLYEAVSFTDDKLVNGDTREYLMSWNSTGQYMAVGFLNGEVQIIDTACFEMTK